MMDFRLAWAAFKNMLRFAARDPLWAIIAIVTSPLRAATYLVQNGIPAGRCSPPMRSATCPKTSNCCSSPGNARSSPASSPITPMQNSGGCSTKHKG